MAGRQEDRKTGRQRRRPTTVSCLSPAGSLGFLFVFLGARGLGLGLDALVIFPGPRFVLFLGWGTNYKDKYLIELVQQALSRRRQTLCKDTPTPGQNLNILFDSSTGSLPPGGLRYAAIGICLRILALSFLSAAAAAAAHLANHSYVNLSIPEGRPASLHILIITPWQSIDPPIAHRPSPS